MDKEDVEEQAMESEGDHELQKELEVGNLPQLSRKKMLIVLFC